MTDATTRRARLDAILDEGGLERASAADRAWLAAERAKDASFDREVAAALRAEAHLRDWGAHVRSAGQAPDQALDGVLDGILAGLDAGLYDDGLVFDAPPRFTDEEGEVVALGARPAAARASEAAAAPAAVSAPLQPHATRRAPRDGRLMSYLAAAAALVLVVTAGVSMVRVSSAPQASESAVSLEASAPQAAPSAAPVAPPSVVAPAPAAQPQLERAEGAAGDLYFASDDEARLRAGAGRAVGGHGGEAPFDDAPPNDAQARRPAGSSSSAAPTSPAPAITRAAAQESVELLVMQDQAAAPPVQRPTAGVVAPAEAEAPGSTDASRGATASGGASAATRAPSRYTTQAAMQQAMSQCVTGQRVLTYQVASGTGLVRVLSAPGASQQELSCLSGVAARTTVTPAPGVARRQQVTLRTVPDTSAR